MENFRQDGSHRVVVTGIGTVNPLGLDVPGFWDALVNGRSGIVPRAGVVTRVVVVVVVP